jgi:hypothetical protein
MAALLLALISSCEKPYFGQEIQLKFNDRNTNYKVAIGDRLEPVHSGQSVVLVRVSGDEVKVITVYAYDPETGQLCGSTMIQVSGSGPYEVSLACVHVDAAPPPDAEVLVDAGSPDTSPDLAPDTGPSPACQSYCQTMGDRCPMVYLGQEDCLATCAAYGWPAGQRTQSDNVVECRTGVALTTTPSNMLFPCYQAGPTGGKFCGSLCVNYCQAAQRNCPALLPNGSFAACLSSCKEPAPHPAYRSDTGNTLECRIFWLGEAGKTAEGGKICDRLGEGATDSPCHD